MMVLDIGYWLFVIQICDQSENISESGQQKMCLCIV